MKCEEIFAALELLEKERGIPQDFMMGKIIQALTAAYKKDHEGVENVIVDVNEEKKDLRMYVQKEIVEEVENPGSQISLEDARAMSAKYQLKHMIARIILVFFSFYILFLANSWQDVLWYGFGLVSLTLIVMIVYLFMKWYTNKYQ